MIPIAPLTCCTRPSVSSAGLALGMRRSVATSGWRRSTPTVAAATGSRAGWLLPDGPLRRLRVRPPGRSQLSTSLAVTAYPARRPGRRRRAEAFRLPSVPDFVSVCQRRSGQRRESSETGWEQQLLALAVLQPARRRRRLDVKPTPRSRLAPRSPRIVLAASADSESTGTAKRFPPPTGGAVRHGSS